MAALADPTRRAILERLRSEGEATVSALAQPFRMSLRGLLKHVAVLQAAGLVQTRKAGRERRVRLHAAGLECVMAYADALRDVAWRFDAAAPFIDLGDADVA